LVLGADERGRGHHENGRVNDRGHREIGRERGREYGREYDREYDRGRSGNGRAFILILKHVARDGVMVCEKVDGEGMWMGECC
jgi:hypothetical protein